MELTETEIAYLAGIIDGEGCITVLVNSTGSFTLRVEVGSTSKELVEWFSEKVEQVPIFFTKSKTELHKDSYNVMATGDKAKRLLEKILPYLIVKKKQASIALEYPSSDNRKMIDSRKRYTAEDKLKQAIVYIQLKELNKTGKLEEL